MKTNKFYTAIIALFAFIATIGIAHGSNTLWDYYQERGEALPSVAERKAIAMDLGLRDYAPTALQNTELLKRLQKSLLPSGFENVDSFGSALPNIPADFETSLADRISASDTSMTLVKGTDRYSTALSGLYGFVIDQGESTQEYVTATCTATACTGMTRGLSYTDPNVGSSARAYIHRRGASIKVSDYPQITLMTRMFKGTDGIPNGPMYYDDTHNYSAASSSVIVTKKYVDDTAFVGSPDASLVQKGIIQIPTAAEVAASTSAGSTGARLVIPASMASSSPAIADHIAVITKNTGKIDKGFIDQSENYTWTGDNTFATTTVATSTITNLTTTNATSTAATTTIMYVGSNGLTVGATSTTALINNSDAGGYHYHPAKIVMATRAMDAATGSVNVAHGLGRTPKYIKITAIGPNYGTEPPVAQSFGYSNGTNHYSVYQNSAFDGSGSFYAVSDQSSTYDVFIKTAVASGAYKTQTASVTFDATNLVFGWTYSNDGGSLSSNINIMIEVY